MTAFHEILFPLDIALKSAGGPERRTEIVAFGSGREARNARWAHSRRRYDAGYGVKTLDALQVVVAFFEERRGQLYGFRWRDRLDHSSAAPERGVAATDQAIGTGDGATATFQLVKTYGALYAPYQRPIAKPVAGSVRVAVAATEVAEGTAFTVRYDHRGRDVSRRPYSVRGRGGDRGISVRRAGAVRHRLSRSRSLRLRRRRDPENSAGGDQAMRTIPSPALQAKLDSGVTTLCRCWIVTRRDGVVQGFTDHDEDVVLGGVTCRAGTGLSGSEATEQLGLAVDGSEISGALADEELTDADLAAGRYDAAAIEVYLVDWSEPALGVLLAKGVLGEVRREGAAFTAELRSLAHRLAEDSGRLYTATCSADLGDARCTVDLTDAAFRGSGTVATLDGDVEFHRQRARCFRRRLVHRRQAHLHRRRQRRACGRGEDPSRRC